MHPLYTEVYFRKYLRLSIEIFGKQYPTGEDYKTYPQWENFKGLLRDAGVKKILICVGMTVGNISKQFFHCPITENSPTEEAVRKKNFVIEEILL